MGDVPLVELFQQAIGTLIPDFGNSADRIGLAVSGGPDSLALLFLAHEAYPGRIAAATVDHKLREDSAAEAEFVAKLCAEQSVPHQILVPSIPIRGSIQAAARKSRYELLNGWMEHENIQWLATAHHADDQLETLIMRVLRGSGIDGMSGIRAKRGHLIRPLLHIPKKKLEEYVAAQGVTAVDDPSNRDQGFDRVRVRNALVHLEGFDTRLASQSARALDDTRQAINWMVEGLAEQYIEEKEEASCALTRADFPHEILRRLVLRCLHICNPALSPRGEQLENCIAAMENGQKVTLGNILCEGGNKWTFAQAPARNTG